VDLALTFDPTFGAATLASTDPFAFTPPPIDPPTLMSKAIFIFHIN
jgi:hypothetical protein